MNDKELDDVMDQKIPEADKNARKIAINLAVSQFSQEFNQGNTHSARPISNHDTPPSKNTLWSQLMNFLKKSNSRHAFATVAVGFIAFSLVSQMPDLESSDSPKEIFAPEALVDPNQTNVTAKSSVKAEVVANPSLPSKIKQAERDELVEGEFQTEFSSEPAPASPVTTALEEIAVTSSSVGNSAVAGNNAANHDSAEAHNRAAAKYKDAAAPMILARREDKPGRQLSKVSGDIIAPTQVLIQDLNVDPMPNISPQRPDLKEQYPEHQENNLKLVQQEPVSTFSADVDTASYSLVRSQLLRGFLPAPTAVRTEEMINYFSYDYPIPDSQAAPFKANISVLNSPWSESKKLLHIGIKGYNIKPAKAPDSNLVFLLDVSGSMSDANKLPLVKQSISLLLNKLKPTDKVSIVVYAGAAGVVLEPTEAKNKGKIIAALQRLNAGGSTAGGAGIELAYQLAEQNFNANAVNRIILATDGDFNVGQSNNEALKTLVERKRDNGVFLSILGFGRHNYQDDMMQTLAQNGNGVAAYIDSISEAKKVLVDQASSTLFTIAKDVKLQVEFNPITVSDYRLVGYETRHLNREDFNNDKVDAGDIGAGHTVTAIYEITPSNVSNTMIDPLRYATKPSKGAIKSSGLDDANKESGKATEYGFLKIRYKLPKQSVSKLIEHPILIAQAKRNSTERSDLNFSVAAASFAQYLKGGKYTGKMTLSDIIALAKSSKGDDPYGYRSEFIQLLELAEIAKP